MEASYDYGTVYIELITYYCEIVKGEIYLSVHDGYESLPENYPIVERIREDFRVI